MARLDVEWRGLDQLRSRLQSGHLLRPTRKFVEQLGRVGHKTAQRAAKPHPADKGTLGRAIRLDIEQGGQVARVYPIRRLTGIALTIEEGRKPGRRPPYTPIKRWAQAHGYITSGRGASKEVRALRERIKIAGTRGIHFMRQASETVEKAMREGIPETERDIKALWDRG